ncbi:MAG: cupin domain-containing protein [Candidatus Paceibacterota bacterium]
MNYIEAYEDKDKIVKFYFTHSSPEFTTGVMIIQPHKELPKHNRPLAIEHLIQISSTCVMKLFIDETNFEEKVMNPGDCIQIPQAQYHIHSNPSDLESVTLFRAEGDITKVMEVIRKEYNEIKL